jgi:hypothetical protein
MASLLFYTQAQAEEAVTSLGDELAAATKRATQLEGSLKAKDKEVDRLSKQVGGACPC